jgi:lipopolysaccharide/colanic/teichoic acid biosynthesis glycosyltransferase
LVSITTILSKKLAIAVLLIKNVFDRFLAFSLLLILFPFLLIICLWLWIGLWENPFFVQERVGKGGKHFKIIKLKTIAERSRGRMQKTQDFLRSTHIDELPQLLNILTGSMSIVGPRPHTPEHVAQYEPWQRERLAVKPGITCLRQLKNPYEKTQFFEGIEDDVEYIRSWSLWLDMKIVIKTAAVAIKLIWHTRG